MITDSISNSRQHQSGRKLDNKLPRFTENSFSKLKNSKELVNSSAVRPYKKLVPQNTQIKRGVSSLVPVQNSQDMSQFFGAKFFKPRTPLNSSFQLLDSSKAAVPIQNVPSRPTSVGSKSIRPAFLEPEVQSSHFPSKSLLITPASQVKGEEEPYMFPLFRTKQINGFKLSMSPEIADNDSSFKTMKTPHGYISNPAGSSRTQRNPMNFMEKFIEKKSENYNSIVTNPMYGVKY